MKEIELTRGKVALVDDEDFEWLNQYSWHARKKERTWYAWRSWRISRTKTGSISMHRMIMNTPPDLQVDHIDHNGLNNQRSNLRNCTHQQNHMNCRPMNGGKYVGIKYDRIYDCYSAAIKAEGVIKNIGRYPTAEEAAEAHDLAAVYYFGEFAYLNFPERIREYTDSADDFIRSREKNMSSKFIGVSRSKVWGRWEAYVSRNKKRWHCMFDDEVEAAIARDKVAVRLYGSSAKLNFPEKINEYLCGINKEHEEGVFKS